MSPRSSAREPRDAFTARRPRRATRPLGPIGAVTVAVALGAVGLAAVGLPDTGSSRPEDRTTVQEPTVPTTADAQGTEGAPHEDRPATVASVGRTQLVLPSPRVTFIGFHEAANDQALPLTVETALTTDLTYREVVHAEEATSDLGVRPVVALPSRGRANAPTSAIDLVLPVDAEVLAPVTGTVVEVERYALYSRHPDVKIGIVPDDSPQHQVVIIHVEEPQVSVGDHVEAGRSVIAARPNVLPFGSQVDRFTARHGERPHPHVHVEVKLHRG